MSNPQHEPTMEEILASIRKIISEDSAEPEPEPKADPMLAPVHDDVLELTEEIHDASAPVALAPEPVAPVAHVEPEPVPVAHDDIEFRTTEEEPPMVAPEPVVHVEPEPPAPVQIEAPAEQDHGLFSDKSRKAMDDIFAGIGDDEEEEHEPARAASVPGVDGETVAAVFERAIKDSFDPVLKAWLGNNKADLIEGMKPVIREWLDQHFPAMLEEAVRNEVARVAKARSRR